MKIVKEYGVLLIQFVRKNWILLLIFAVYVSVAYFCRWQTCILKLLIGYPCPGCGMTRAVFSLFRLDFAQAFYYHPLVFLLPVVLWVIVFSKRPLISKIHRSTIFWSILLVLVLVVYILRWFYVYPEIPMDYNEHNLLHFILSFLKR